MFATKKMMFAGLKRGAYIKVGPHSIARTLHEKCHATHQNPMFSARKPEFFGSSVCTRCQDGKGDEKHMVFECSALQHIRDEYPALFAGHHTMRSFMNLADQSSIIHFISECLDCNHMVGAV